MLELFANTANTNDSSRNVNTMVIIRPPLDYTIKNVEYNVYQIKQDYSVHIYLFGSFCTHLDVEIKKKKKKRGA